MNGIFLHGTTAPLSNSLSLATKTEGLRYRVPEQSFVLRTGLRCNRLKNLESIQWIFFGRYLRTKLYLGRKKGSMIAGFKFACDFWITFCPKF
jgi:hypothetical protein